LQLGDRQGRDNQQGREAGPAAAGRRQDTKAGEGAERLGLRTQGAVGALGARVNQ
jgi:hypothetical protein